ncbi:MAG: hypothetical protein FWF56_05440 [Firmicutes bacterium]|nr:hypothetical protein [Bacillota bacterium]MCL1953862.1 hypothetical protein [Bacillota bacterium]
MQNKCTQFGDSMQQDKSQYEMATVKVGVQEQAMVCSVVDLKIELQQQVVVQSSKGKYLGSVINLLPKEHVVNSTEELSQIVRIATNVDVETYNDNLEKINGSISTCTKLAEQLKLDINVVDAEYSLDKARLTFYFKAKQRVDFRELARELAKVFKVYIDLRQVADTKDVQKLALIGPCGRNCCCSIGIQRQASIKMVKNQNISLNPSSTTGPCGNIKCCMAFENEQYANINRKCPKIGGGCCNKEGKVGQVSSINYLKETAKVKHINDDGVEIVEYSIDDIKGI